MGVARYLESMGRRQYAVHRWLAAVVGLQLFLWCLGGFIFSTHDIAAVRGEDELNPEWVQSVQFSQVERTPAEACQAIGAVDVESVVLRSLLGRPVYQITHADGTAVVDATTGQRVSITQEDARSIAVADRLEPVSVLRTDLITADPETEYRGGDLPAWRVELDDDSNTHIYVSATTGRITARRNDMWRRFDFFWMLHTMDYGGRDDFNSWLLIGASTFGLITISSGWLLWFVRLRRRWKKRSKTKASVRPEAATELSKAELSKAELSKASVRPEAATER